MDRAGVGAGVDDDVEFVVLHGGVEVFLDGGVQAVDFVDEEDIAFLQAGENACEVACFFDLWAGCGVELGANGGGDDVGEGSFPQSRWAGEEDMVEDVVAHFGGLDAEGEEFFDLFLAGELGEGGWAEGDVEGRFGSGGGFRVEVFAHGQGRVMPRDWLIHLK